MRALAAWATSLAVLLGGAGIAGAAFPGPDPDESVRANAPNDPRFDQCERDNEGGQQCSNPFDEELERFGFAPNASERTALYLGGDTARQQAQNAAAGRNPLGQVSGISADRAWKRSIGRPDVEVAILDTGIVWRNADVRKKIALNEAELPRPRQGAAECPADDCNGDGAFDVDDFAQDPRVGPAAGRDDEAETDKVLDASDLLAVFSDGTDEDRNGYVDDIAGWDFFDDDNNAFDASSYSAGNNHGTGRAVEAGAQTNDGAGGTGVCPRCQVVPLRIWDTFVVDTNNFALASLYAADNGIEVVEAAIGGLLSTRFVAEAMREAYRKGVFFAIVSSDLNTANHNSPTIYEEAMMVAGSVADAQGLGSDSEIFTSPVPTNVPIGTWFRNSGLTQYGGHAAVVMPATTGSQATGQAAGAAGLVMSYARDRGIELAPNEVKQVLTLTAEDVVAENTVGTGVPDPAQPGWDQHFGYGRVDLGHALERVASGRIPPQALIATPKWFEPFNVRDHARVEIGGRVSARGGRLTYRLQWAPGIEPAEAEFREAGGGTVDGPLDGALGTIDLRAVRAALDARPGGGAANDPTAPAKGPGDRDPNEPAFTVRVVVTAADGTRGEHRKTLFAYRDTTEVYRSQRGTGGEASPRLFDLDGDNALDTVLADSSGALHVLDAEGRPLRSFNRGRPVLTRVAANVHPDAPSFRRVEPPREALHTPAIGDVDGDEVADLVATAGEHVYAWSARGVPLEGFPVRVDPALSAPAIRTKKNHVKRGFFAAPTLADLDGQRPLEIIAPALDQHVYVVDGRGRALPGFPLKLDDPKLDGAEITTAASVGDLDGRPGPELVLPTQEFDGSAASPEPPDGLEPLVAGIRGLVTNAAANAAGGSGRTYALKPDGKVLPRWPIKPGGLAPDVLPLVGPGVEGVLADVDGDDDLESIGTVTSGDLQATSADGRTRVTYDPMPGTGDVVDRTRVVNFFEHPIAGDLDGRPGLEVVKGGFTLNQVTNLLLVGQNNPYNHVVQAWDARTGTSLPAFPQAVEDYQLLSSPAMADVSDAPGKELLVGTGLYLLRNINADGAEGEGFPKFTGGWLFAVPAVGDADGDGKLDISTITREGNAFLWRTTRPACGGNDEWWTSRHDEWSSGAYGTDTRPPGTATGLRAADGTLRFRAPGDDWACGKARRFRVITNNCPIGGPRDGRVVAEGAAAALGVEQEVALPAPRLRRRVAVAFQDDAGNWGLVAQTAAPGTKPLPTEPDATPPRVSLRVRAARRPGRALVRWQGRDGRGSGAGCFQVQQRPAGAKRWRSVLKRARVLGTQVRGRPGRRLEVRVRAIDEAGNVGPFRVRTVRLGRR